jgi:hypothetical protein
VFSFPPFARKKRSVRHSLEGGQGWGARLNLALSSSTLAG